MADVQHFDRVKSSTKPRPRKRKTLSSSIAEIAPERRVSPCMTLHLTPDVTLSIWKHRSGTQLQIEDGQTKINIPPHLWKIIHLSAEAISLLLSFIEGKGGIADYYRSHYASMGTCADETHDTPNEGVKSSQDHMDTNVKVNTSGIQAKVNQS